MAQHFLLAKAGRSITVHINDRGLFIRGGIALVSLQAGGTSLFIFGNSNQLTNANMSNGIVRGTITYITN
jgi:hypothetical protein